MGHVAQRIGSDAHGGYLRRGLVTRHYDGHVSEASKIARRFCWRSASITILGIGLHPPYFEWETTHPLKYITALPEEIVVAAEPHGAN